MKLFTIREANSLIPEVREILEELRFTKGQITERSKEIELNCPASKSPDELVQTDPDVRSLSIYFEQLLGKYRTRGIICRSVERGLFDFPALAKDRYIYLCWLASEDTVEWWHDIEAGFNGRKLLVDAPLADEMVLKVAN